MSSTAHYEIDDVLGIGGMGEVFRGRRVGIAGFSRPVALKRISSSATTPEAAALLEREARIAATLSHPNVVAVLDFDRDLAGQVWMAMELVDGVNLRQLATLASEAGRPMPRALVAWIGCEILRALEHAHAAGVVHRDVSPHNVLVAKSGAVKLSDFGIAKTAASECSGTVRGKIAYLSPEQAAGDAVDGRSDLFSLGVVLYELLSGARPFRGATDAEVLASIFRGQLVPLGRGDLEAVVMRLLSVDRGRRHANAADARRALMACTCWPADGMDELRAFAAEVEIGAKAADGGATLTRPAAGEGEGAGEGAGKIGVSVRALRILAVLAFVSVIVAAVAWMTPRAPEARAGKKIAAAKVTTVARAARFERRR